MPGCVGCRQDAHLHEAGSASLGMSVQRCRAMGTEQDGLFYPWRIAGLFLTQKSRFFPSLATICLLQQIPAAAWPHGRVLTPRGAEGGL